MTTLSTLIAIVVLAAVVYFVFWIVDAAGTPAPFNWAIKAIVGILAIVKILAIAGIA